MNILSIENKFKALDEKEAKVRQYFNPKSKKGDKHHYIADIRADFHYDTLLYGLGMFWMQEETEKSEELKQDPLDTQPVAIIKPDLKPKSPILARRKNLALLELQKPLLKDHYDGVFSHTKVLNHDYLYKKPYVEFTKSGWKTAAIANRSTKNKAAKEDVMYSSRIKDCRQEISEKIQQYKSDSPHKLDKQQTAAVTADAFKKYLEESKELVFTGKEPPKFELALDSLRKVVIEKDQIPPVPPLFQIYFSPGVNLTVKSESLLATVSLTDINSNEFPTKLFKDLPVENSIVKMNGLGHFDLKAIFGEGIEGHTIRVLVQVNNNNADYYVCLKEYKQGLETSVKKEIIYYKTILYTMITKGQKTNKVVPLTLQKLAEGVSANPPRLTLPSIESKTRPVLSKKKNYNNPITPALFSYKKATESFHPQAYPANLSIFEAHDFIEENYTLPPRARVPSSKPEVSLAVSGHGLSNPFLR